MAAIPILNMTASKRVPFDETIPDYRDDYSGGTPLMEIRTEPGGDGTALVSLGASTSGSEGVALTYDAARIFDYRGVTYTGASLIQVIINEATLEALAYGADPSDDVTLYYDLHLTVAGVNGGKKFVALEGKFIIKPGVTQ